MQSLLQKGTGNSGKDKIDAKKRWKRQKFAIKAIEDN